jgi:group I intron endonuclease
MFIVYRIINKKNGKSYVGFTSKSLEYRWKEHVYAALNRNSHYRLHAAIRKYGVDNFERVVLAETPDGHNALNVLEPHFIIEFDTRKNGYNTKPGGSNRGWKHTEEACRKMSLNNHWRGKSRSGDLNPMFGQHQSDEVKRKISKANSGKTPRLGAVLSEATKLKIKQKAVERYANGFKNPRRGKYHTSESLRKMSEIKKGKVTHCKSYMIIHPNGRFEKITNLSAFCREHDLSVSNMSSVATGSLKQHKGFRCSHVEVNQ